MIPREPRKELGAAQVAALWRRGTNHVGGVRGLILNVTMYGSRSWVLRYQVAGKSYGVCQGQVCTVPATVVIAPDQTVRLFKSGYNPADSLEKELNVASNGAVRP